MPLCVDLHTPNIDAGIRMGHIGIQIVHHLLGIVKEQTFAGVIQRPWPCFIGAVRLNA